MLLLDIRKFLLFGHLVFFYPISFNRGIFFPHAIVCEFEHFLIRTQFNINCRIMTNTALIIIVDEHDVCRYKSDT